MDDENFQKVFSDPNIILRVLRSNLDGIQTQFNETHHDEIKEVESYGQSAERLMTNFISAVSEEVVNVRNAQIISDEKLLRDTSQGRMTAEETNRVSNGLIEETLREIQDLKDQKKGLESSARMDVFKNVATQVYELLIENLKLRRGLNELFEISH